MLVVHIYAAWDILEFLIFTQKSPPEGEIVYAETRSVSITERKFVVVGADGVIRERCVISG